MKTRPGDYAPWLIGMTVDQFCDNSVMPMNAEIENVSLNALKDVLLSPAGIALEVMYLDRTEGSEVNMHRFDPVAHPGGTLGTIRLLYRPGHYDILYKTEDLPQASAPIAYLQYGSHTHFEPVQDLGYSDVLSMIPGMSYATQHPVWMSGSTYGSDFFSSPAPVQQCSQAVATPVTPAPQPHIQAQPTQFVTAAPSHLVAPPLQMPQEMAIRTAPHASLAPSAFHSQLSGPFRPSAWELEPDFRHATSQVQYQTSIFKK
jgi:ubiquitin thioesterase protein OTUB1